MEILSYALFGLLIVISPGADFVLVFKNSISLGRKAGILTGLGIGLGVCVHVTYSILGISHLISQNEVLLSVVKYAGAAYLIYIGLSGILGSRFNVESCSEPETKRGAHKYFAQGFLCNALNPKTMLFFLSVFSQLISAGGGYDTFVYVYAAYLAVLHAVWFCLIAFVATSNSLTSIFQRFGHRINQVCGVGLVSFGLMLM